jgi:hypothetical protein
VEAGVISRRFYPCGRAGSRVDPHPSQWFVWGVAWREPEGEGGASSLSRAPFVPFGSANRGGIFSPWFAELAWGVDYAPWVGEEASYL